MGTKANNWVAQKATKKKWHNYYFLSSFFSFMLFVLAFGLLFIKTYNKDIDNSGMALVIIIPPLIMTVILLLASSLTRFYYYKKNIKIDNAIFVIMGLLTIPVLLFGLLCFGLTILTLIGFIIG